MQELNSSLTSSHLTLAESTLTLPKCFCLEQIIDKLMGNAKNEVDRVSEADLKVEETADACCCANCGVAEVDDIQLEDCDDCDLVKYCGDKCKEDHREKHEEECKKRAKELHDKELFTQECPLCFLPMPLDPRISWFKSCCSKTICDGCEYAHHVHNGSKTCPFCREPVASDEENKKRIMRRIKANDPAAISEMGTERYNEGDYDSAVKYWKKAAELGDVGAHYQLGHSYHEGDVVEKDEEKEVYHYEKAAIGGHPEARHNLGCYEERNDFSMCSWE